MNRKKQEYRQKIWFKLDNAAKLYPSIINPRTTTLFRLSVSLFKPVNVTKLQAALSKVVRRTPYFKVNLKRGFFWNYFETNKHEPKVQPDSKYPCTYLVMRGVNSFPFRIRAYKSRIALEISHALTDGTGALMFLKMIVFAYLKELGADLPLPIDIPDPDKKMKSWEYEDCFKKFYKKGVPYNSVYGKAYHLKYKLLSRGKYIITTAKIDLCTILMKAKSYDVSITTYITALYMNSFLIHLKTNKNTGDGPIRIMIPVNLRKIFKTDTMLNFFLTIGPEIDPRIENYTFKEIIEQVHLYLKKELTRKSMLQQISKNVGNEQKFFIRSIPLLVKNIILPIVYKKRGQNLSTSSVSNLGRVEFGNEYDTYISEVNFIPVPSAIHKVSMSLLSYNESLQINMGRLIQEPVIEKYFFRLLVKEGIPVKIESNEVY